jgi:ATPase subunit of ABC transporter with duplicated ATPase domains
VISTQALELRAGARLLVKGVTVRINNGDRIGFVGRNGAGKSTLAKVLAGENMPAGGAVNRTGKIGYLPQDPRVGEETGSVIERILSARNLDQISHRMRVVEEEMATSEGEALEKAMDRYTRVEHEFSAAGGYAATAEAEAIVQITSANPGIPHHKERLKPHTMLSIALLTTKLKTSSNQAISETSECSTTQRMISTSKQVTLIP